MSQQMLAVLDALENYLLECSHMPFSKNIIVDSEKIMNLIKKLRMVISTEGQVVNRKFGSHFPPEQTVSRSMPIIPHTPVVREAEQYAQEVLAHLESIVTRIQHQIEGGKEKLKNLKRR